jgi:dipeptidyl aminopeptidase/acylaminoacyl peptidase
VLLLRLSCWFLGWFLANEICCRDAMIQLPVIAFQEVAMLYPIGHFFCAVAAVAVTLFAGTAWCAAPLQPIENFTKRPVLSDVTLSPSGNRMAVIMFNKEGRRMLATMNLNPIGETKVVGVYSDADVTKVMWVNDQRLVYEAFQDGPEIREGGAATFAVNFDGSNVRQLISWRSAMDSTRSSIRSRILPYGWFLRAAVDSEGDEVHVERVVKDNIGETKQIELARLNTTTGEIRSQSYGMPEGAMSWLLDQQQVPRVVSAYKSGRTKIYWREPVSDKWLEVADFDTYAEPGFTPLLIDSEGQLIVGSRAGSDTTALYKFDPATKRLSPEPLLKVGGFDLPNGAETDSRTKRLVGWHFTADRPVSYWFDDGINQIQRSIDKALPAGRSNRLYCGRCETSRFFVVQSSSDRQPSEYFLYDREKLSMERIGASMPWIDEATQGTRSYHRVATRDGLSMPVYVTHPAGSQATTPLPAIVLVHGGPWVRGSSLSWDAEAQFLASRGYRVLQPEFRGSSGYGSKLFKASWKQWGLTMQDDLVDAVQWAAKQALVDASKVCITGGSYGGYASLMAPIATPGVFKCAASFAGVTDIDLMYAITWSDFSEEYKRFGMPVLVGDRVKDAAQLARTSPLKRVAEIKVPVLLGHGGSDVRVPIKHATEFFDAARSSGVNVERIFYPEEGHGFFDPKNATDYYARLEKFFAKSLLAAP